MSSTDITFLALIGVVVGLPILGWILTSVAADWRKARVAEQAAVLKQSMIERGFTADDILRVIQARPGGKPGDADKV